MCYLHAILVEGKLYFHMFINGKNWSVYNQL